MMQEQTNKQVAVSAETAIQLIIERAQWMRSEGETDMRSMIWFARSILEKIKQGMSEEDIVQYYAEDEDDDE